MMKRLLASSLVILFFSCGGDVPKDVLSIQQMQDIQWDLMRADEMVDYYRVSDTLYRAEEKREEYYSKIFSIHRTSKDAFKRSLNYYTARPNDLKRILDAVRARAEKPANADTAKSATDTGLLKKDTAHLSRAVDSLKRKKLLKIKR